SALHSRFINLGSLLAGHAHITQPPPKEILRALFSAFHELDDEFPGALSGAAWLGAPVGQPPSWPSPIRKWLAQCARQPCLQALMVPALCCSECNPRNK